MIDELGAAGEHLLERARQRGALVRHAALGHDGGTGRRQPLVGDLQRLLDHLGREPGQHGGDDADLADAVGRDAHQRLAAPPRARASRAAFATANGMIFTVAIISPANDRLVGRQASQP